MFWLLLLSLSATTLYFYLTWNYNYWRSRGIKGPEPRPIVGTFPKSAVYLRNFVYELDDIYRAFRDKYPFVGVYTYRQPELLILDPKLVNEIFVGKFKYFERNYTNYNKKNARLFMRNPFILRDQEWKDNRADISPAFSTLKTKQTYPDVDRMCKKLTKFIKSQIENDGKLMDTKEEKRNLQTVDVAAHSLTFFLDAYETSSIVLTHALYRLAQNKNCQTKLRQEIAELNGNLNVDVLSNLKYLDQVFNESLRISPPGFTITKVCTEQTELINCDGRPVTIEKDTVVHVPVYSIHNDPEYFPDPTSFVPERFDSADLKTLRDQGLFFPFGHGHRMCLGMRFATLQIKAAIAEIVSNFEISVNSRTKEPIVVRPKDFLYLSINNVYLDYKLIAK